MATRPPELTPIREQVYKDPRPKEHFDRFHERTRTRRPDWVYDAVRVATSLYAWTFFRARGIDTYKVPASGCSGSTRTAACSRCAAATRTRRRS
jgi:hypothetical protein